MHLALSGRKKTDSKHNEISVSAGQSSKDICRLNTQERTGFLTIFQVSALNSSI